MKLKGLFAITLALTLLSVAVPSPLTTSSGKGGPTDLDQNTKLLTESIALPNESVTKTTNTQPSGHHSILCGNQSSNQVLKHEGRPTTPPYKRLITSILSQLHSISQSKTTESLQQQIANLENDVIKSNNELLPSAIIRDLCEILSTLSSAGKINQMLEMKVKDLNATIDQIAEDYDYEAHRMKKSDEQRLLGELMMNYEKGVRPVLKASEPVELKIGVTLNQIDVDEKNQVLTVLVWLDQEWTDEKLIWDPANYSGLEVLRIPCHLLWLPDIVLYNSVEDFREGYMQAIAMVSYDGNVFWPPIVKYKGNCEIEIKYFPYDDQVCKLKLGSWAYDGYQVNMTKRKAGIDLSNYQSNGEWQLLRTETKRNVETYTCCPQPYIDITFTIYLRRRTLYYVYNIIIPCIMLSILTLLSFWMKPDSGEKVNLGLTILLAFSVFMLLIAESMPSTSFHVPIIGIYITSSMCLTAVSVLSAVFVANINHQAEGDTVVPYWIHKITYNLGRLMCVKMVSWEERHCNIRQLAMIALGPRSTSPKKNRHKRSSENECNGTVKAEDKGDSQEEDPLLKRLHTIVEHQEELLKKQNSSDDWHAVALIMDRCLFWIYFLMMASTTIGCIFIFPTMKKSLDGPGNLDPPR